MTNAVSYQGYASDRTGVWLLYRDEITDWLGEGRRLRAGPPAREAERLSAPIACGAQIMVCGGREMAAGVMEALAQVLPALGPTSHVLRAPGKYVENVY